MTATAATAPERSAQEKQLQAAAEVISIEMTPQEAEEIVNSYVKHVRFGWWDLGAAYLTITKLEYWKQFKLPFEQQNIGEPYHSFEDFINRRLQSARSTAYRHMKLRTELGVLKAEDGKRISQSNAKWLLIYKQRAGESKWCNPSIIEKAISMHEDDFAEFINGKLPGAAKEEKLEEFRLKMPKSLKKLHVKTWAVAEWQQTEGGEEKLETVPTEQETYEYLLTFYLNSQSENHEQGISNLQAYEERRKSKKRRVTVH